MKRIAGIILMLIICLTAGTAQGQEVFLHGAVPEDFSGNAAIRWDSGASYEGTMQNGLFHGQGTYTWPDGSVYKGGWQEDLQSGYGVLELDSGVTYEGNWANGLFSGIGKLKLREGDVYEGEFAEGVYEHHGIYRFHDSPAYREGEWSKGLLNGAGTAVDENQVTYRGNFVDDVFNGEGTLSFPDGIRFSGVFTDGTPVSGSVILPGQGSGPAGDSALYSFFFSTATPETKPGDEVSFQWELENTGEKTWTTDYSITFYRGNDLYGEGIGHLNAETEPGLIGRFILTFPWPEKFSGPAWFLFRNEKDEPFFLVSL